MRKFQVIEAPQRSAEWFAARLGRLTGSRAKDVLATIKAGEAAARRDYRLQLVCERLTGVVQEDGFVSADMQRGIEKESDAFSAYEAQTGLVVQRSGFLAHTDHAMGCSLDGHVGDYEGIVEIKVPRSANHLRYLRGGVAPAEHMPQILHNLLVTDAAWADFVSFDDRFPPELQVFIVRVERNEREVAEYERKALAFLSEVDVEAAAVATLSNVGAVLREVSA